MGANPATPASQRRVVLRAANSARNRQVPGSALGEIRSGLSRCSSEVRAMRSTAGSGSGTANAGVSHPALPADAPAATSRRS